MRNTAGADLTRPLPDPWLQELARSVLSLMDLPPGVPRQSTLSRRRRTLDIQPIRPSAQGPTEGDRHIKMIQGHGRIAWQEATDYGRRSLVETATGRYKSIRGNGLNARDDDAQVTEVAIGIKALNRMIRAAKPISARA